MPNNKPRLNNPNPKVIRVNIPQNLNWFQRTWKNHKMIVIITIILLVVIALLIGFILIGGMKGVKKQFKTAEETITNQQDDLRANLEAQLNSIRATGGIPGPQGPAGMMGPTGGSYLAAGTLTNKAIDNLVVDRSVGQGCNVSYLNLKNRMPSQRWVLNNDNTIQNYYSTNNSKGKCLTREGNNLLLEKCSGNANQKFIWSTLTGQLVLKNDINYCIDTTKRDIAEDNCYAANPEGTSSKDGMRDNYTKKSNLKKTPDILVLSECSNNKPSQVWAFSS
jgi:hypothetical protein